MGWRARVWCPRVILLCGLAASGGAAAETAQSPTIRVKVNDLAGLPAGAVTRAASDAMGIFREAGLDATWVEDPGEGDGANRPPAEVSVRVVILPEVASEAMCKRAALGASVMGVALVGPALRDSGTAWVFYNRIQNAALARGRHPLAGLVHVMAHEAGHVLLGTNGHAASGLMQAGWNPSITLFETFRPAEVKRIHARFSTMDTLTQVIDTTTGTSR